MFLKEVLFSQMVTDGDHNNLLIKPYHEDLIGNQTMIMIKTFPLKHGKNYRLLVLEFVISGIFRRIFLLMNNKRLISIEINKRKVA